MNEITQEDIDKAWENFTSFSECLPVVCPKPTRVFEIGESVKFGNLNDCIVVESIYDGKAYRIDYTREPDREQKRKGLGPKRETRFDWWHVIQKKDFCSVDADRLFIDYLPGQVLINSLDSIMHNVRHGGIVCDPRYQRGYVWSKDDQEYLLDSVFNRINIGAFVFSRNSGYLYGEDCTETVDYISLDGDKITINKKDNYTRAIVDGQQRLTTLWKFMTNQITYKGKYWKELHFRDQIDFEGTNTSVRVYDEEDVKYKDVLRMFIQINRGVPQVEAHLDKVKLQLMEL